ncbi:ABC transporter substrate-binding protein [Roseateles sp.]|uniref:ABC transporter substrate-binding protein n=1 Tax=Roseateles sp. TaxID=1971397 RepID=UPI0025EA8799|nr:ABC transporter substrate-binding protein [Roseateles sp.]MBV8036152.1 ABC transporter substrate-binding protein [Roseateles sp.]
MKAAALSRRRLVAAALACHAAGLARATAALVPLTLMVKADGLDKPHYAPITLAKALGFYTLAGLDVRLVNEVEGVNADAELAAGRVQAVAGFYDKLITDLARPDAPRGLNIATLADTPGYVLLASTRLADLPPGPAALRGRRVAVTGLGKIAHLLVNQVAATAGLATNDFQALALGGRVAAALASGEADFGIFWGQEALKAVDAGHARIHCDLISRDATLPLFGGLFASTCVYVDPVRQPTDAEAVRRLAGALSRTLAWMQANGPVEAANRLPANYARGDAELHRRALALAWPSFTADGRLQPGTAENMLRVLSAWRPELRRSGLDPASSFSNRFIDRAQG